MYSKHLIIGFGVVGQALHKLMIDKLPIEDEIFIYDINKKVFNREWLEEKTTNWFTDEASILSECNECYCHITIPQGFTPPEYDEFRRLIIRFIEAGRSMTLIIHSSITPDIISDLKSYILLDDRHEESDYPQIYYSPIRATEKYLNEHLKMVKKFIAPIYDRNLSELDIIEYFEGLGLKIEFFESAESLALGKLISVAWFGYNIAFVQQIKMICDNKGFNYDFHQVYTQFVRDSYVGVDYNEDDPLVFMKRPIFRPGVIEGKCVIPNAQLLWLFQPNQISETIIRINELFKLHIADSKNMGIRPEDA